MDPVEQITGEYWPPGLYYDIPDAEYRDIPAASHSDLQAFVRGKPANLGRKALAGKAAHCAVLEPGEFKHRYCKGPPESDSWSLARTLDKQRLVDFLAETGQVGKEMLKPTKGAQSVRAVNNLYAAVRNDAWAKEMLAGPGRTEVVAVARLEGFATPVKCRIDKELADGLLDFKTTHCADREMFIDSVVKYGYASQGALYLDVYAAASGAYDHREFVFLCVSTEPPYEVWHAQIGNKSAAFGRRWYRDVLTLYERYGREGDDERDR